MVVRYKDQAKTAVSNVSFQVADCSRNPQWQELAYATVLDRADSNGGAVKSTIQWDIFNQFFPRGAGKHLSTEKMRSKCIMEHLDEKRLARLQCEFVGQSHDSESHLLFSRLNFDRGSNQLVIAEGKKFKNGLEACEDAKFCTVIRVPNEGTIEIIETLGSGKPERVGISAPQALTPISAGLDPLDQNALGEVIKPAEDPAEKVDPQAQNL